MKRRDSGRGGNVTPIIKECIGMIETLSARFIATFVVSSCAPDSSHQNENVGSNEFISMKV